MMKTGGRILFSLAGLLLLAFGTAAGQAAEMGRSKAQTVYVPVYSDIYFGDRPNSIKLAVTLSIRNTDLAHPITVTSAKYYDSHGKMLREHVKEPVKISPVAATYFFIKESESVGGSGACFIVQWKSDKYVSPPVIESVMIGTAGTQGISFVSRGQVMKGTLK